MKNMTGTDMDMYKKALHEQKAGGMASRDELEYMVLEWSLEFVISDDEEEALLEYVRSLFEDGKGA